MKIRHILIALVVMMMFLLTACGGSDSDTAGTYTPAELDTAATYYADIDIEDYGVITIELDQEAAPVTCANFVELAESGFYDGLTFHRIIAGFMMQGGDPLGNGTGGSENNIVGEFSSNGIDNDLSHERGVISMARSSDPNSASSQFFICHEDSDFLDGDYAAFGVVTEGLDVVDAVCTEAQPTDSNGTIPAEAQPVIKTITIRTK
jgi:peptidyl-prolyl cis-trans isomerase B (cyclophilin B)